HGNQLGGDEELAERRTERFRISVINFGKSPSDFNHHIENSSEINLFEINFGESPVWDCFLNVSSHLGYEDDDIIDEEDPIPHDLADSDDEDLVNLDIDDGMLADVAWGHGGDGGGDARPLHIMYLPTVGGVALALPFLEPNAARAKGEGRGKDKTQFDLRFHMESDRWPQIYAGIQQHLRKIYNGKNAALKERYWVPEADKTYDLERIRRGRASYISEVDWDTHPTFWNDPKNLARAAQNKQNRAKSKVV
nr:hypothetical protein [Tanacetum cinerariifolium]